ncbi:hypothetical protein MA04_02974 [Alcanivorax balearicus MACL04]|uniref:DUF1963 domain-containing protein n=1 Tax=Alloalcanivorax balearicus MACL04 TaxID=1177182 RepID=A0ABT2R1N6_9GAMM|nr:DUF1963 domain-containing protein [Alloalcanivorax balearicus]MCU5783674.1 hypothetical protein [Alloalcanivorax balearicus MACL04]
MEHVETRTFSIDIPGQFGFVRPLWESVRAEYETDDDMVMINAGVDDDHLLRQHHGDHFATRFREYCLSRRGQVEITAEYALTVHGRAAQVITARNGQGDAFYFTGIEMDAGHHFELTGDCLVTEERIWFPLFEQTLMSVQLFGDPAAALADQRQGVEALLARPQSKTREEATPDPPPFNVPADHREYFDIDDHGFDFLPESEYYISAHGHTGGDLMIDLKARARDHDDAVHGAFLNDYDDGEIALRFSLNGVYHPDSPQGRISFEADRDTAGAAYLWKEGFHYSVELYGELTLINGWVGFEGYLRDDFEKRSHRLRIAKRLPLEQLDWHHYRFTAMAELRQAPKTLPRHVSLSNLTGVDLPPDLFGYTSLESLTVQYNPADRSADGLRVLADDIARLRHLHTLYLSNARALDSLPPALATLPELERLMISGSGITAIAGGILDLPKLNTCLLDGNQLQRLPGTFSPSLRSLSLARNKLTTIPAALAALPELRHLDLQGNPLTALPQDLRDLPGLKLELEKRQTLFDYRYPGADGLGTVPFDDGVFLARHDEALNTLLAQALRDEQWAPYRHDLIKLARRTVALATTEADDYSEVGNTRFGGLPDLPAGESYPRLHGNDSPGYQFIAQLHCAELAPYQDYLPRSGLLYFFISDQEDPRALVRYQSGPVSTLRSAAGLNLSDDDIGDDHGLYSPFRARAGLSVSLPHFYSDQDYYRDAPSLAPLEDQFELTETLTETLKNALTETAAAPPVHAVNSFVFKQHDTPEIEAALALGGEQDDFMVLLRVSSDNNPGFCFWDAGEIYFVIHKSDLAKADFSNVYCGLESS